MPVLKVKTDEIRADLYRFRQELDQTIDIENLLDALLELDQLRNAVSAYLDNDSQNNWDALAELMDFDA